MRAFRAEIIFICGIRECAAKISTLYIPSAHRLHVARGGEAHFEAGHLLAASQKRSEDPTVMHYWWGAQQNASSKQVHYRIIFAHYSARCVDERDSWMLNFSAQTMGWHALVAIIIYGAHATCRNSYQITDVCTCCGERPYLRAECVYASGKKVRTGRDTIAASSRKIDTSLYCSRNIISYFFRSSSFIILKSRQY